MKIGKYILITVLPIIVFLSIIINKNTIVDGNINDYQENLNIVNEDIQADEVVYDYFTTKIEDINKLINDEIVGYVYFARDTCPICLKFNENLEKEFKQNENLLIYKFDTDYWREDKDFRNILDKYAISEVPMLIKINEDKSYQIFEVNDVEKLQSELNNFLYN